MRAAPAVLRLALCLSSLTPIVSAWPGWLPEKDALYVRQDDEETENTSAVESEGSSTVSEDEDRTTTARDGDRTSTEEEEEASRTTETSAEETTANEDEDNEDNEDEEATTTTTVRDQNTAVPDESGTRTGSDGSRVTSRTTFDPAGYAGGVEMITPNTVQVATALYKIGDNIELAWNYTNLQATPTAVDVLVSCSAASETWTLTANMTFETEVSYVWETEEYSENADAPLLTEMYTLIIKDVEAEVSDRAEAGYLGSNQGFTFGLYYPAAYTPLSEWECTTCNAGPGGFDSQALKLAITMAFITVCSFTWFVTGLGLH